MICFSFQTLSKGLFMRMALVAIAVFPFSSMAQEMPTANEASPNIYKVLAETEKMRVIIGIWKPGDRDKWHGHPASSVFYVTDCHVRLFFPDGSQVELQREKGKGRARDEPVISHSLQNIGEKECRILMTEFKTSPQ